MLITLKNKITNVEKLKTTLIINNESTPVNKL